VLFPTLSNGQILAKGDQIYAGIYGNTYQELMLEQAIKNILSIDKTIFFNILIPPFNLYFNYISKQEKSQGIFQFSFKK